MIGEKLQEHINQEYKTILVNHEERLNVANSEMGAVKTDVGILKTDVMWIKEKVEELSNKTWWILGSITFGILVQILLKVFSK